MTTRICTNRGLSPCQYPDKCGESGKCHRRRLGSWAAAARPDPAPPRPFAMTDAQVVEFMRDNCKIELTEAAVFLIRSFDRP